MAQVYRFTDENGLVRLFAEIEPSPNALPDIRSVPVGVVTGQLGIQRASGFGYAIMFGDGSMDLEGPEGQAVLIVPTGQLFSAATPAGPAAFECDNNGMVSVALGTLKLPGIPTADPHVIGQLYSVAGTVHVSAG